MKLVTCFERRFIMDINAKIETFLEKWNEMLTVANEIEEFKWRFEVGITSDNSLTPERVRTINGINESFTTHDMTWSSSNN
jgi:hypothetical protein